MLADVQVTTPTQQQKKQLKMKACHIMVVYAGSHDYWKWHMANTDVRPFLPREVPRGATPDFVDAMEEAAAWLADGTAFLSSAA